MEFAILRQKYYPKISTDSMQSLLKFKQPFFFRNGKASSQIHMELQGSLNSKNNLKKEKQSWGTHISHFKTHYKSTVTKIVS